MLNVYNFWNRSYIAIQCLDVILRNMLGLVPPPGGLPYKSDGDGRRFGLGPGNCKFWSHLGCLGWKVTIFAPFKYRLVLCIKKFIKTALTVTKQKSPSGVCLSFSHTHIGLLQQFHLNFLTSNPVTFIWYSLPPPGVPRYLVHTRGRAIPSQSFSVLFFPLNFVNNTVFKSAWFSTSLYLFLTWLMQHQNCRI